MPLRMFLSHASADKPIVREVKTALEEGGDIECWLDEVETGYGENIAAKVDEALDLVDSMLSGPRVSGSR